MRWVLAVLAAVLVTVGVVAVYADRALFSADGFAERTDAALRSEPVSADVARRLTDEVIRARPDLVAVRPLVASVAESLVRGAAFRSLVRGAARDVHRSVFDRDAGTVTLTVADTGVLVAEALRYVRPDLARQIPAGLQVRISRATSDFETATVRAAAFADRVRVTAWVALVCGLLLAAVAVFRERRAAVARLGVALAAVAGLVALVAALAPVVLVDDRALRAVLAAWLDPLAVWCAALAGAGAIATLAATAILRPLPLLPRLWRAARRPRGAAAGGHRVAGPAAAGVHRRPPGRRTRRRGVPATPRAPTRPSRGTRVPVWLRALVVIALGAALLVEPLAMLEIAAMAAGLLLVLAGAGELLRLAGRAAPAAACAASRAARGSPASRSCSSSARRGRGRGGRRSRARAHRRLQRPRRPLRPPARRGLLRRDAQLDVGRRRARLAVRRPGRGDRGAAARRRPLAADRHALRVRHAARRRHRPHARLQEPRQGRSPRSGRASSRPRSGCARGSATPAAARARSSSATRSARSARRARSRRSRACIASSSRTRRRS